MVTMVNTLVRSATERDRQQLANLVHFESYVHRHLDWRAPLDWLGFSPFLVLERNKELLASLACPPEPPEIAWLRLFAVSSRFKVRQAWEALWSVAGEALKEMGEKSVAAIPLQGWLQDLFAKSDFSHIQNIVLLLWENGQPLPPDAEKKQIRQMTLNDIKDVLEVDSSAFDRLWRVSITSLELAFRQSGVATVAVHEGEIVAYQISTASPLGGHLARLAVKSQFQGQGFGYALLRNMLEQFSTRSASRVTVNTQKDNAMSLALYEKAGFKYSGEEYPVFHYSL